MRVAGSGIYRIILGAFPAIDLPKDSEGMMLGAREALLADLRLTPSSAEILDFGSGAKVAQSERTALRNHTKPGHLRLSGETGKAMLLGHRTDIRHPEENLHRGLRPGNAGDLL